MAKQFIEVRKQKEQKYLNTPWHVHVVTYNVEKEI